MSHSRNGSISPLSGRSPSPYFSAASPHEQAVWDSPLDVEMSASRPVSPGLSEGLGEIEELDTVICQWEACGKPFSHLPTLIDHIHSEHIGVNKSTYTCEWATCSRRGLQQASRFALISHIRAHTGEKPFTCPRPECDKSFTRSDAMAKHMRLQHNIDPPLPGRGGNRKRKRDDAADASAAADAANSQGYTAFKVEGRTPSDAAHSGSTGLWEHEDGMSPPMDDRSGTNGDYFTRRPRGNAVAGPSGRRRSASIVDDYPDAQMSGDERDDGTGPGGIPARLLQVMDPQTGKIHDRSPAMVKYIVMKAKHRYVLEQHENLLEELRVMRNEERTARELKEEALDQILRSQLGPRAEFLIQPIQVPQSHSVLSVPVENYLLSVETNGHGHGHGVESHPY